VHQAELAATRARLAEALTQVATLSAALLAIRGQVASVPVVRSSPAGSSAGYYRSRAQHTPAPAAPVLVTAPRGEMGVINVATVTHSTPPTRTATERERERTRSDAELDAECVRRMLFDPRLSAVLQAIHTVPSQRGSSGADVPSSAAATRSQSTNTLADCLHRTVGCQHVDVITVPAADELKASGSGQSGSVDTSSKPLVAHTGTHRTNWEDGLSDASLPPAAAFVLASSTSAQKNRSSPGQGPTNARQIPWTSVSSDEDE
jgi:hypothetical protein